MAKAKFERNKPHVNIGTTGHVDHGKTTLTAAITHCLSTEGLAASEASMRSTTRRKKKSVVLRSRSRIKSTRRRSVTTRTLMPRTRRLHQEHDHRCGPDGRRDPRGCSDRRPDAADARAHFAHAPGRRAAIVVFLNKVDMVDDEELIELVEMEVRELLNQYDFPGDNTPVIRGSALKALNSTGRRRRGCESDLRADGGDR